MTLARISNLFIDPGPSVARAAEDPMMIDIAAQLDRTFGESYEAVRIACHLLAGAKVVHEQAESNEKRVELLKKYAIYLGETECKDETMAAAVTSVAALVVVLVGTPGGPTGDDLFKQAVAVAGMGIRLTKAFEAAMAYERKIGVTNDHREGD